MKILRPTQLIRRGTFLFICTVALSGCSGSSNPESNLVLTNEYDATVSTVNESEPSFDVSASTPSIEANDSNLVDDTSTQVTTESSLPSTVHVGFDITVPAYMSDDLHMRLLWADIEINAQWVYGENWVVFHEFPADTESLLEITFSDSHGNLVLASYERVFKTDTTDSQILQINANDFDETPWDNDNDGRSNLDELLAGTNPDVVNAPDPVQPTLSFEQDKTFRLNWQTTPTAQSYRVLENPDGISGFTDVSGELSAVTGSYDHRVALYARVNAQYLVQSCRGDICVDSELVMVMGTMEGAIGYFKASNTEAPDCFGTAVSLSADGNTMAVAAVQEESVASGINGNQDDNSRIHTGAVYVFSRTDGYWKQQAYIKSDDPQNNDRFGTAVGLTADGNTLAVGSKNTETVYIYARQNGEWQQQDKITASNSESGDYFGEALSLSADGNTIAIGASGESSSATGVNGNQNNNFIYHAGAVYVYVRHNGTWQQQAYLKANNAQVTDQFGKALSLSADGDTLAVGAVYKQRATSGTEASNIGAVYVFARNNGSWNQQAHLYSETTGASTLFGWSVSLSGDGKTLAIGAPSESVSTGAVYVYAHIEEHWIQQVRLNASNARQYAYFGISLSLSMNGNTLAVGADEEFSAFTGVNAEQNDALARASGAVYMFVRDGGDWHQQAYLKASNTDGRDKFGAAISISLDGNTLAVGAVNEQSSATGINGDQTDNSLRGPGAVYLY